MVVINKSKEVEFGGPRLEGNGLKDPPKAFEVQPTKPVNGVKKF